MERRSRTLERSWRASGSVEDEARWLAGRVRTRDLDTERLELAACCDHPAARDALAGLGIELSPTSWVTDVKRWGNDVCLRAAWFAALRALPAWESAFAKDQRPERALQLVADWLDGPTNEGETTDEETSLPASRAAELAQRELAEAAEYAGSAAARLAENACVSAYFAVRCLEAVARDSERELRIPVDWLRRRPARKALSTQPPSVIDDFLTAERRAARARHEAPAVTRVEINAAVAAWCLREE